MVLTTPTFVDALLYTLGSAPILFGENQDLNKKRLFDLFRTLIQGDQMMMDEGCFISEHIGWVKTENESVTFRLNHVGRVVADLGTGDENKILVEREAAYAWLCEDEEGRDMYAKDEARVEKKTGQADDVESEWPVWSESKTYSLQGSSSTILLCL